jgi:uncharacterized protein (DUF58 family)
LAIVLLKLLAVVLPLTILAWRLRIYPRMRFVLAALFPAVATIIIFALPEAFWVIGTIDGVIASIVIFDLFTLPRWRHFGVERHSSRIASLGKIHPVTLSILNHVRRRFRISISDDAPHELHADPSDFDVPLAPRSRSTLHYELRPARRGAFALRTVHLRAESWLGFWQRFLDYPCETLLNVYPDMQQLSQYALLARTNRLSLLGVRRTRRIGEDHDFERLRDYTLDDNYKHIDWRATARRRKLTVKDFQTSQSQRIIFLIDCGRMMTNKSGELSLLDHSLNAMLMLSYVALRQGDSVGMISFSDDIHSFIPPRGGMNQMNHLLHASFDRFPRLVESRYDLAFRYMASHCRKRSLVVLVTNVIDEVNARQIEGYMTNLVGRHLPLGVWLRDHRLFDAVATEPQWAEVPSIATAPWASYTSEDAFWRAAAAAEIISWRHQAIADLQRQGVLAIDVFPEAIKARHLL